jgi:hypothetical protein
MRPCRGRPGVGLPVGLPVWAYREAPVAGRFQWPAAAVSAT